MPSHTVTNEPLVDPADYEKFCSCGQPHPDYPVQLIAGIDAFTVLAEDCRQGGDDQAVLLLDDAHTHVAAGKDILELLKRYNVACQWICLPGDIHADADVVSQVSRAVAGHRLLIAVGAGTINDIGKYASTAEKIPYWCVPTAASMNGYTSAIAAIKVDGVKETLPAKPPPRVYAHPGVIAAAPEILRQSGFCDILAKFVSDVDWQCESLLFGERYCRLPGALIQAIERSYITAPEKIAAGDREAVMGLFKALLVSGISMSLAGSSAPASGGEHLISHFFDMREEITGRKPELHGLQVGAGIVVAASCYRHLAAMDRSRLPGNADDLIATDARRIAATWGANAAAVERMFAKKANRLDGFDDRLFRQWDALKALFATVRPPEDFTRLIRRAGFPLTLESLHVSPEEFLLAVETARTIRNRITVLDLAAHAGVMAAAARDALTLLR